MICRKKFDAANELISAHLPRKAREAYREYSESLATHVLENESLEKCEGRIYDDFEKEFREKLISAKNLAKTYGNKTFELVKPHIQRYTDLVRDLADNIAHNEQSKCDEIGIPWKPSDYLLRIYKAADYVEQRIKTGHFNNSGAPPKVIADFVVYNE